VRGRIVKGIGGFYYVSDDGGSVHECKAKGVFRKQGVRPTVGDYVLFTEETGQGYGLIEEVLSRKNELVRPAVSNVDALVLVVSAARPKVDALLCDKLILQAEQKGIEVLLCINKVDVQQEDLKRLQKQYAAYGQVCTSAETGEGLDGLKEWIAGKCVCMAGQSAVGKTSLINALDASLSLETGGLSKKTGRGRHTTRQAELLYLPEVNAYIVDTPGFSMFETGGIQKEEVPGYYREFAPYAGECKFAGCMHISEPGCMVKAAVERGEIDEGRYRRYVKIVSEMKQGY